MWVTGNYKLDIFMSLPLMILAVFSIFFGFVTKDMFIGLGSGFFADNALFIHPSHEIMLDTEFGVPTLFKLLPLVFTISLSIISIVLSEYLSTLLINKYGFKVSVISAGKINQYNLYVSKNSMKKLSQIIKPYLHPSMYYKLNGYI